MAILIKCKICNHDISSIAEVCKNCSHPIKKERDDNNNFIQILLILGVIVIFAGLQKYGYLDTVLNQILSFFIRK